MIIELRGVEFVNKGAELMMKAIIAQIRERFPSAILVMEVNTRATSLQITENGMYHKINKRKFKIDLAKVGMLIPKFLRRKAGFVLPSEVNVVLDGSGFAFGDQWGPQYAEKRIGSSIEAWNSNGIKTILLPQAFGPFTDTKLKTVMSKIIKNATLVFARDSQSQTYLIDTCSSKNIHLAPDFTNLISGIVPKDFDSDKCQVAIIPNYKMIEKSVDQDTYFNFLFKTIDLIKANNLRPYFLIHEGQRDSEIAANVNAAYPGEKLEIVSYDDPLIIKGIISTAKFIVCSRFHGVVSALSQAVPCISTSWSHKYEMLARDYSFEESVIKDLRNYEMLASRIKDFSDSKINQELRARLKSASEAQKMKSKKMWDLVFETIKK
ncbi:polysaccharide pyruvyl transferase family protein [Dyadobacter aurulentus]|uniref:polysaccharide pyruvyl transferase family protein n=1 Tax=Dyadobacter sp. UC 10 TaxID=2605428 RepID=UPI0011F0D362|nr:polysaccharide pyruvyl transferase family protein [Dyadobacter sp. UC 10]KAA0988869.1 polysaccharide pyruvyl transferase family protein [Dyadobacter sp. UC 10]